MPIASEKHVKSESLCACCRCAIKICAADTGFRQLQFNVCSGREVAGQMRNKRPHLFVTGRHQERRRPAVALHPDDIEIFLRLPQFLFALGADGSAAMEIRIDQWRERFNGFGWRGDARADFAVEGKIRPTSRIDNDATNAAQNKWLPLFFQHAEHGKAWLMRPESTSSWMREPSSPRASNASFSSPP